MPVSTGLTKLLHRQLLRDLDTDDAAFDAKRRVMMNDVQHHVEKEESETFTCISLNKRDIAHPFDHSESEPRWRSLQLYR